MDLIQVEKNIVLFRELVSCHSDVYMWTYDMQGRLLESNCPYEQILSFVYSVFGCKEKMLEYGAQNTMPLCLGTELGISWLLGYYKEDGILKKIYAVGPYWNTTVSLNEINRALAYCKELTPNVEQKKRLTEVLKKLPVLSSLVSNQFAVMLHYCISEEKIKISNIENWHEKRSFAEEKPTGKDRHKVWALEQNMLRMVREGDLNYKDALNDSAVVSEGVPVRGGDLTRQAKDSVIISVSLCTRAAIEGGMSPEQAYSLGDAYIQSVEDARTGSEIASIHDRMYEDFVLRVHQCRENPGSSKMIRECCSYIDMHTEDKISIAKLGEYTGYTEYYLSRKFKEEMGISINTYIKKAKIERAKFLLSTTDIGIQEIADRLNFCSRSHFGETFRCLTKESPGEFREKNWRKKNFG